MKDATAISKLSLVAAVFITLSLGNLFISSGGQAAATAVESPPEDLRGIYVYSEHLAQYAEQLAQALTVPGTDGLTLLQGWTSLEPSRGSYRWTELDQWMSTAVSSGKKVVLAIRAGQDTPCWLFQSPQCGAEYAKPYAGATPLTFLNSPRGGVGQETCHSETIAAPWDPVFLSEWDSLLAAVAAHLKSMGTYDALVAVRLTGINRTTAELRLPAEMLTTPCVTNSLEAWLQMTPPYRPSRLLGAWDKLTSSYQKNLPDKFFGVEIIPTANGPFNLEYPFPAIDDNGCAYQPPWPSDPNDPNYVPTACLNTSVVPDQNAPLLALASRKFPGRLSVSYQNLDLRVPAEPYVAYAAQTWGTMVGFQTNDYDDFQRAACSGGFNHPGPCDSASYLALLEVGIYPLGRADKLRAQYIEVLPPDVIAFPDAIQKAHVELTPDILGIEVAKQKGSGKLIVYATSTDTKATLSLTAIPVASGRPPIDLGIMSKTDPNGNEFFITKKGLAPIGSVEITSTSGGSLTAVVKGH